jgi:anti-anti-sigma factor
MTMPFEQARRVSAFTEKFGAGKAKLRLFSDGVRFDVERKGIMCRLDVRGTIDIFNSGELDAKIAELGRENQGAILVSFACCGFVDCSCVRVLIRQFKLLGERLLIAAPEETALYRMLQLTNLAKFLPVHASFPDASLAVAPGISRVAQRYTTSA